MFDPMPLITASFNCAWSAWPSELNRFDVSFRSITDAIWRIWGSGSLNAICINAGKRSWLLFNSFIWFVATDAFSGVNRSAIICRNPSILLFLSIHTLFHLLNIWVKVNFNVGSREQCVSIYSLWFEISLFWKSWPESTKNQQIMSESINDQTWAKVTKKHENLEIKYNDVQA